MTVTNHNANLPDNINRIINERGLKQCAVAERAGYSRQQFNDMLNGRKIIKPCDTLAIAAALGVEAGELYAKGVKEKVDKKR
ncbi:helix-turn-helix domain-containing protein [Youxingia wuxianensis]|uniref:Helix-turn-helix transcriptional regulator n=1 Tax=Youxingia wuxianensis TaxID=2763678 RepID=A0A926EMA9_9FIRM|nr:helix-turn-helix transcriptional regulator [Youxingia wuxianensis]MBC8586083.1 helix-turn-helix transcriptional regulator [Youxingia wuxianensis]